MPVVEAVVHVDVPPAVAFAVSQTTGEIRLRWDRFIRRQGFQGGATVGMKMITGPWFFEKMGGGWRFEPDGAGTRAVWRYNFTCRPAWLAPIAEWIGVRVLQREIDRRVAGFAAGCADPIVLAAVA